MRRCIALVTFAVAAADVYLHNPRGSNNRLDDENRDRNNGNRLFDSQNNNRGGSNVGQVYYLAGSKVPMEWSVQHSCGNPNNNCEIIVQAMCDDRVRDGTTQRTIPDEPNECYNWDCDTDVRFGRHESFDWYMGCKYRSRNMGLFTSSQNLNGNSAIYTRQNPNGARRGLECPEERDYYPYWHPTPWKDVAILTNQPERCAAYQAESQNVKDRFFCSVSITGFMRWFSDRSVPGPKTLLPLEQVACEAITYFDKELNVTSHGQWMRTASHGIPPPVCKANVWSRDNHHGNVEGGQWTGWDWTVPSWMISEQCVMRLRYNISTGDIAHFDDDTTVETASLTAENNKSPGGNNQKPAMVDIGTFYGVPNSTVMNRDYTLRNNPQPDSFGIDGLPVPLQLAINTAQFGRTFQDRTHKFAVRAVPEALTGATITNIQVRGKRGNVVQTYPGTEYDFTPSSFKCRNGDYVHFQWTGSNTNPNNNAGQGRQGSDRHNVVSMRVKNYEEPITTDAQIQGLDVFGHRGNSYPHKIQDWSFLGFEESDMQHLAILDTVGGQFGGEMSELDDAGTYFDLGPRQCTSNGVYNYLCTRNNNFSNRSQKAVVTVSDMASSMFYLDGAASSFTMSELSLSSPAGVSGVVQPIEVLTASADKFPGFANSELVAASDIVFLSDFDLAGGKALTLTINYEAGALTAPNMVRAASPGAEWVTVEGNVASDGLASGEITQGGYYAVAAPLDAGPIVGIVLGCLAVIGLIGFVVYKKRSGDGFGHVSATQNHI
jgi:plastocyanin